MHGRNPKGEIFVLNALPLPHDTIGGGYTIDSLFRADLATFNRMLDSAVTVRRQSWQSRQEGGAWMVDAYAPMSLLPDSAYNPVYFCDFIHPNQKGYTLMGNRIIQTIKANTRIFK
jgi:lysophospholipase L1-like esterase